MSVLRRCAPCVIAFVAMAGVGLSQDQKDAPLGNSKKPPLQAGSQVDVVRLLALIYDGLKWFGAVVRDEAAPPKPAPPASEPSRDSLEKLSERELLPKMPSKLLPWRPTPTIDDVPEVSFEGLLPESEGQLGATGHTIETLLKIHRLQR